MRRNLQTYCFVALFLFAGCSKKIIVNDLSEEPSGHFMFGRVPERSFYYPFKLGSSIELRWIADTKGSFKNTSVCFYDSLMFTGDLSGNIYLFELTRGKERGKEKNKGAVNTAPIIFPPSIAYVVEEQKENYSTVYFYDFYKGDFLKEFEFFGSCSNELLKSEVAVFMLTDFGELYKFSLRGELIWKTETNVISRCTPAMSKGKIYFGNLNGEIICIDASKGSIVYREKITRSIESGLSIDGKRIYFGDDDGILFCVELNSADIIWEFDTGAKIKTIPVFNDKDLFVGNLMGDIYSLNKNNGEENWAIETGGIINATPILFDDVLVQPDLHKVIHFVNKDSGEIVKRIDVESRVRMSPVFYNNFLYFGIDKGEIMAYERVEGE